jgi:hypothetical protein
MIDISYGKNPDLYQDFKKALEFLRGLDENTFQYPQHQVNFNLYSEITDRKQLLSVKSYFATQNLEKTKLILWSDWDITGIPELQRFKSMIDFRILDPIELAKGTILEGHTDILLLEDKTHYMRSGLLRFLSPYKFGGIWFDMDMVLLRDLKPILDQEFAYVWGMNYDNFCIDGPCAAFLNILKESDHARICLEELKQAPLNPDSTARDCDMLAKVYARRPFTVFPSAFFNTEWQINKTYPGLGDQIQNGWFKRTEHSSNLFLEAFSWHWHNGGGRNVYNSIESGSKFDLLEKVIDEKLRQKGF